MECADGGIMLPTHPLALFWEVFSTWRIAAFVGMDEFSFGVYLPPGVAPPLLLGGTVIFISVNYHDQ